MQVVNDADKKIRITRRFGKAAHYKMIGMKLTGICSTEAVAQDTTITSPVTLGIEREHGGLFRGALARI